MRNDSVFGVLRFHPSRGLPALGLLRQTRLFVVRTVVLLTREGEQVCETGVTVTEGPLGVGMVRNDRRCKEKSVQVQRKGGPGALKAQWTKEAPEHTSDL